MINYPRLLLIENINLRTRTMIEKGAVSEVENLIKLKIPKEKSISKAIGIHEYL